MADIDFPTSTMCLSPNFKEIRVPMYSPDKNKQNNDRRGKNTRQLKRFEGLELLRRTNAQVVDFVDVFHDVTCEMGTKVFNVPHPRTGNIIEAMFIKPPDVVKTGHTYRVEFGLVEV